MLVIGINSDRSIRELKGKGRPIIEEQARAEVLAALGFVDYVFIFSETDVSSYLREFRPQVYVKAEDYDLEKMNQDERKAIENYGGKITFLPIKNKMSTTAIIEKIRTLEHE